MLKQCRACTFFTPQMYNAEPQSIGRCIHIAFLKAGFGKTTGKVGDKLDIQNMGLIERLPPATVNELHKDQYFYQDHIDIKLQRGRFCGHWRSPTINAQMVLDYYGESWDYVKNFPNLAPPLAKWIADGFPTVEVYYPKLNKIQNMDYTVRELPPEALAYETCQSCHFFKPEIDEQGAPVPFKGKCGRNTVAEQGVFSVVEQDEMPKVYSFMGCTFHRFSESINTKEGADAATEIPQRLTLFVETNPIELSMSDYLAIFKFPTVTRNRQVDEAEYNALMDTDLVDTLRTRHRQIDFNSFFADMALQPVAAFFSRGLAAGSKEHKQFWGQFDHYKSADDLLFAPLAVPEPTDDEIIAEFGSSLTPT